MRPGSIEMSRWSRPEVFSKKVVLKNLKSSKKFTGKHLCRTLFLKSCRPQAYTVLFKKRLRHIIFPVNV